MNCPASVLEYMRQSIGSCWATCGVHAGGTQDSTRVWRAIIYGCIPVTYFRAVELPFMRRLGIDYGQFSINIQPDDYDTTQACYCFYMPTRAVVAHLQAATHVHYLLTMPCSAVHQAAV